MNKAKKGALVTDKENQPVPERKDVEFTVFLPGGKSITGTPVGPGAPDSDECREPPKLTFRDRCAFFFLNMKWWWTMWREGKFMKHFRRRVLKVRD